MIFTWIFAFQNIAFPATLRVGEGENYATIQDAVDAASEGDTIYVGPGTFAGFEVDTPDLTIIGEGPSETELTSSASFFTGARGANFAGFSWSEDTLLIPLFSEVSIAISEVEFTDLALLGDDVETAIYIGSETIDLEVTLENVTCTGFQKRCLFLKRAKATISDLSASGMEFDELGAMLVTLSDVRIDGGQFLSLTGNSDGVALYSRSSDLVLSDVDFDDIKTTGETSLGTALTAEGITLEDGVGSLDLQDCTFRNITGGKAALAAHTIESLRVSDLSILQAENANQDYLLSALYVPSVELADVELSGLTDEEVIAPVVVAGVDDLQITDLYLQDLSATVGALYLGGNSVVEATRVSAVDVIAPALLAVYDTDLGEGEVHNILGCSTDGSHAYSLLESQAGSSDEARWVVEHALLTHTDGPIVDASDGIVSVRDSLFLGSPTFSGKADWQAVGTDAVNAGSLVEQLDPLLGNTDLGGCTLPLLEPHPDSAAVDAGVGASDINGTTSDLGILGGPEAWVFDASDDADRDGIGWYHDCDDDDPNITTCTEDSGDTSDDAAGRWIPRSSCSTTLCTQPTASFLPLLVPLLVARRRRQVPTSKSCLRGRRCVTSPD